MCAPAEFGGRSPLATPNMLSVLSSHPQAYSWGSWAERSIQMMMSDLRD